MKIAVIDTETSGLFDFAKPADAEGQPRLANLAVIMLDDELRVMAEHDFYVQPVGWQMTEEATKVNGLTTEFLLTNGEPVRTIQRRYSTLVEEGFVIAAFNAQFDTKVMRGELRRAQMPDLFEQTPNICLMRAMTNVCRIPKKSGGGYKFPKLSEACAFLKLEQPSAHSALGDARSAVEILRHLHKANLLPKPEVHFAKARPV